MTPRRVCIVSAIVAVTVGIALAAYLADRHDSEFLRVAIPGYVTGFGTLALAGTTVWLSHKEQQTRYLERSHVAAQAITRSMRSVVDAVDAANMVDPLRIRDWAYDVSTYSGDILDLEVVRRLGLVLTELQEFDNWNKGKESPLGLPKDRTHAELRAHQDRIIRRLNWINDTLSAHRNGKPFPPGAEKS